MSLAGHDQRRRTARRRLILAGVVAAAVVGGGVSAAVLSSGGTSTDAAPHRTTAAPSGGTPSSSSTGPAPSGVTVLPKAQRVQGGVPVGYPHTELGAVSAAAHFTDTLDVFTPSAAEQQAKVVAEPGYTHMISTYALYSARRARTAAGLPEDGESDTGTYSTNQTRGYQTAAASTADRVVVWLLVSISTSVHGVSHTSNQVDGLIMVWKGGDWKMSADNVGGGLPASHPLVAPPDSDQAASQGWRTVAYAK